MEAKQTSSAERSGAKQSRRMIQVFDSKKVDKFVLPPSPKKTVDESELRIQEILDDLTRITNEEIENWSQGQDDDFEPIRASSQTRDTMVQEREMVRSPVSPASKLESLPNMKPALSSSVREQTEITGGHKSAELAEYSKAGTVKQSATAKGSLSFPDKPTFQSFLQRVAKTPPVTPVGVTAVRDFAYSEQQQAVADVVDSTDSLSLPEATSAETSVESEGEIRPNMVRSTTMPCPKFAAERNPYHRAEGAISDTDIDSTLVRKMRPRSNSMPVMVIKRKPLPADSPLLLPPSQHSALVRTDSFVGKHSQGLIDRQKARLERQKGKVEQLRSRRPPLDSDKAQQSRQRLMSK